MMFLRHCSFVLLSYSFIVSVNAYRQARTSCLPDNEYDFIIVGAGATGSVIANRLTETPEWRVLLLEAGGEPIRESFIPLITFKALGTEMDWNFIAEPQRNCCAAFKNQVPPFNRGKALGGTSSINFMTYTRGNRRDFDRWRELGNEGWGWDDVFPYFLKLEDYQVPREKCQENEKYHREGGPMTVEIPTFKTPIAEAFLQGGWQMGYPLVDYNAKEQIGFMYPPVTIRNGSRCSSYVGYLQPVLHRPNLQVASNALVTKILFSENKVATGVVYEKQGESCVAKANKEVILSAGAIGSPHLLLLSGIGSQETLDYFQIPIVHDLEGVGLNLHDHAFFGGALYTTEDKVTYNSVRYETPKYEKLWEETGTGPMTCPVSFEGLAFIATKLSVDPNWPDIEIFFNSDNALRIFKPFLHESLASIIPPDEQDAVVPFPVLLRPKSRGYLTLRSSDPHEQPVIDPKYFSHDDDVKVMMEGLGYIEALMNTKAMQQFRFRLLLDGALPPCKQFLGNRELYARCSISFMTSGAYHPCGTCKMGPYSDPLAVVDNELKVHGLRGIRVADASIMPEIVAGHPQASCFMIGEKVSDLIKNEYSARNPDYEYQQRRLFNHRRYD